MANHLGTHLLVDFAECNVELLDDEVYLRSSCTTAAEEMGASVVAVHSHRFEPYGVSVMIILAESHLSLHSWPEYGMASADIYVCGDTADPQKGKLLLGESLKAKKVTELEVARGQLVRTFQPKQTELNPLSGK